MKQKLILLALVIGLTIVSQSTLSLGMGNIRVYSSLDEQLSSTIELTTNPEEELEDLTVTLASSSDYKKVGLDKSFVPSNIIVTLDEENPNIINVTSNGPISEPIVSLLLDVNWNNGRILREFTVLLDPAVYDVGSNDVQINQVVVEPIKEKMIEEPASEPLQEDASAETNQNVYTNEDVTQYDEVGDESVTEPVSESVNNNYNINQDDVVVNEGDTLWRIANQNKVGDLSTNQMMIAIYNNNSSAFIDNNINKLIKGSQLDMPTMEQAQAISFAEALSQVQSHHQQFTPAQQDYSSYQTTAAEDEVYEDTTSSLDYGVQLSGGDNQASDNGQTNAEVGDAEEAELSEEELFNQESEKVEMQERITALEDIVDQQQTVLEIKDDGLANLESQLDEAAENVNDSVDDMVDAESVSDDVWDSVDGEAAEVDAVDVDEVNAAENDLSIEVADTDSTIEGSMDDLVEVEEDTAIDTVPVKKAVPQFSVPDEKESMVDKSINWVMANLQWVLIGLGALVLLLLVPKFLRSRADSDDDTSFLDDIKPKDKGEASNSVETKMNKPLDSDDFEEDDFDSSETNEDSDDVLANLDKSIAFEDDSEEVEFNFEEIEELDDEVEEVSRVNENEFDLDGFLNDDAQSDGDLSVTADHSSTLAGVDFGLVDNDDDDDDDLEDLIEKTSEQADDTVGEIKDDVLESFDLDDEDDKTASDDEFNFEEDFDFDLDEELEEIEQAGGSSTASTEGEPLNSDDSEDEDLDEDFDDLLDLSDDDESFDIEIGEDMDEEIDLGLEGLVDDSDAIDTKLDLAKAYLDMGDTEGAKNLLVEVVAEGTSGQVDEAKKILDGM